MTTTFDVAIVGGGPSGSVLALRLAEEGFKVALIEKNSENNFWYKPADALSPRNIENILDVELKVDNEFELTELFDDSGKSIAEFDVSIVVLNRVEIGKQYYSVLKDNGVKILPKTEVKITFIKENPDARPRFVGCIGKYYGKIPARLIIDASGLESVIRQELSQKDETFKVTGSDLMYTLLDEVLVESTTFSKDKLAIILDGNVAPLGYVWITPLKKTWRIGIAMRKSKKYSLQLPPRLFTIRKLFRVKGRVVNRFFGNFPARRPLEKFVYDGVVLVGESALHCSPIYGGGIYGAIKVARELYEEIKKALDKEEYPATKDLWNCEIRLLYHLFLTSALELVFLYLNRLDSKTRRELIERVPTVIKNRVSLIEHLFIAFQGASPELSKYIEDLMSSVIKLEEYYNNFPGPEKINTWINDLHKHVFESWLKALEIA